MKISHTKKQNLYVLPILKDSDEGQGWSWIYFAFIFTNLEDSKCYPPVSSTYRLKKNAEALENVTYLY